jgi:hypothetical protein
MKPLAVAITALTLFVAAPKAEAQTFSVCHGYECYYRTKVTLSAQDLRRVQSLMRQGAQSPAAERKALRSAIALFEQRSTAFIGVRDKPRMQFGKATNTDNFIRYLDARGWLKHHSPARKTTRGSFIDGRYPHWTAVIQAKDGERWAVDSWYEAGGGPPDIMLLAEWKRRGYGGER